MRNKKILFILLFIVLSQTTRTVHPLISLKTKITNFFSNTKNLIWTGLAVLVASSVGIGLLYREYKKEIQEREKKDENP